MAGECCAQAKLSFVSSDTGRVLRVWSAAAALPAGEGYGLVLRAHWDAARRLALAVNGLGCYSVFVVQIS